MQPSRATDTLIAYTDGVPWGKRSRAYCMLDNGQTWGFLLPYVPDTEREIGADPVRIPINPGETLDDAMKGQYGGSVIERPVLQAGQYYPRIWRGGDAYINVGESNPRIFETPYFDSFIGSLEQVESLCDSLSSIFRVAHPAQGNLSAYGGAIRDLIILACTEVEAQWKGVLKANNVTAPGDRFTTAHYVRLLPVMRLDEFKVELIRYPGLPAIGPFKDWDVARPTQSLVWYDVYNRVKHDREVNFKDATLEHAIQAVAACVVMLAAQFGDRTLRKYRFENPFQATKIPMWEPRDWYYGPIPRILWEPVDCPL